MAANDPSTTPSPVAAPPAGDVIHIRNLRAWTLIGVHDFEREARQELRLDLWLWGDTRAAAASDDVGDTIDYAAVARSVREHAGRASHHLVETLAEEVASLCLSEFGALDVCVAIHKPGAVPGADTVGVTITRGRSVGRGTASPSATGSPSSARARSERSDT